MNVSIFGLGYVGAVSCACLAELGHHVIGVDISKKKVDLINSGISPIIENGLDELIKSGRNKQLIAATSSISDAIAKSEVSLICVGTPSQMNGAIDLKYIYKVVEQIATELKSKNSFHTLVIRSTIVPGTIKQCGNVISRISDKKVNEEFGIVSNPEFLREGSALEDFWNPPYTIIGSNSGKATEAVKQLYIDIDAPVHELLPEESEMIKYANNNFHAMKVTFANEVGNICKELGVDGHKVMDIVSKDTKLNLSPYYLKPGFAFGGSCLPKDVRGLTYHARQLDLRTPLLSSLNDSNDYQITRGLELILKTGKKKVGFMGFSFKANTDDLRESPVVALIETLIGKGFHLSLYDNNVSLSRLMGKNKEYIDNHVPHISTLMVDHPSKVIEASDVIVFGNKAEEFQKLLSTIPEKIEIIDLVRIDPKVTTSGNYEGICW